MRAARQPTLGHAGHSLRRDQLFSFAHGRSHITAADFAQDPKKGHQSRPETGHCKKFIGPGVHDAPDAAKALEQFLGQRFGVLAGEPVAQQQFQNLIVGHSGGFMLETLTQSGSVACVQLYGAWLCCHNVSSLGGYARGRDMTIGILPVLGQ